MNEVCGTLSLNCRMFAFCSHCCADCCVYDVQNSTEEDKYGTVKRVVSKPQPANLNLSANLNKNAFTSCLDSSPLMGSTPHTAANPTILSEKALLIGSTASDLSLLTNSVFFSEASFLDDSLSLGSLCNTSTDGKVHCTNGC